MTSIDDHAASPQTLTHSVGIGLPNHEVSILMGRKTILPKSKHIIIRSPVSVHRGAAGEKLTLGLIEGESRKANLNRAIGWLCIPSEEIKQDIPAGADIEITIKIEGNRSVSCSVYVPLLDQVFENALKLEKPLIDIERLEYDFKREMERLHQSLEKALRLDSDEARQIITRQVDEQNLVKAIKKSITEIRVDANEADRAQSLVDNLKSVLDAVENNLEWPALVSSAEEKVKEADRILGQYDTTEDRKQLAQLEEEILSLIRGKDASQVRQKMEEIDTLVVEVLVKQPDFWAFMFRHLETMALTMPDRDKADRLIEEGNQAIQSNDLQKVISTVKQLVSLVPAPGRGKVILDYW